MKTTMTVHETTSFRKNMVKGHKVLYIGRWDYMGTLLYVPNNFAVNLKLF